MQWGGKYASKHFVWIRGTLLLCAAARTICERAVCQLSLSCFSTAPTVSFQDRRARCPPVRSLAAGLFDSTCITGTHMQRRLSFSKHQSLTPSTNMRTGRYCEHDDCMGKSFYYARHFSGDLGFCSRTRSGCDCTLGMSVRGEEEVRPGEEEDNEEGAVSSADASGGGSGLGDGEQSGAHVIDDTETHHADNRGREHFLARRVEGERRTANSVGWRAMCQRCERPAKVCICSSLPKRPIAIETRLIILQHPKERKKATYGTVPIVRLVIKDVHVVSANLNGPTDYYYNYVHPFTSPAAAAAAAAAEATDAGKRHQEKKHQHEMKRSAALCAAFSRDSLLQEALAREDTLLLFPDLDPLDHFHIEVPELMKRGALNLEQHFGKGGSGRVGAEGGCISGRKGRTLIAIDGTWPQAKAIYKHTPSLQKVRRVQFSKDANITGEYTFRKEPKHNFLSTLESISYCISVLEDESRGSPPERDTPPLSSATTHAFEAPTNGSRESEGEDVNCRTASEWLIHAFKTMVATQVSFIPNLESIEGRFGGSSRGNHRELA